jgi:hypothetical protein
MADDSDDQIFIDVVPRVDDSAADSAVDRLRDKFKDVAKDVGPEFMDALNSSGVLEDLGTKLGSAVSDSVGKPLREMSSDIGIDLDAAIGKALNKDWGGLGALAGKGIGGKLSEVLGLEDTLSGLDGILSKAQGIGDVINDFKTGGLSSGLSGAAGLFGHGPDPTANSGPLGDITTLFGNVSALGDAVGHQGLSNAGSILGGGSQILNNFMKDDAPDRSLGDSIGEILEQAGVGAGVGAMIPGIDATGIPSIIGALVGGGSALAHNWDSLGHNLFPPAQAAAQPPDTYGHPLYSSIFGNQPLSSGIDAAGSDNEPSSTTASLYSGDSGSPFLGRGGGTTSANEVDVQASAATISAGSVTLGGSISLPSSLTTGGMGSGGSGRTTSTGVAAAGGDSNSMASLYSGGGGTTIGKAHYDSGGILPGGSPGYDNLIGVLPSGSMVGLEGKEGVVNNKAMGKPGVADLVTMLNKGFDEGTMSPAGVGGDSNNPTLSTTPTTPNTAGGNTPKQPQQFGSGQGGGISGGGIIGAAEQAGVAAAGMAGFGGGSIVAQMAVQESNLAVQKASQNVAALATMPFETFGLSGGQMGAPQVNPMGGWIGKLIGGALGQMNNLPNIAGASVQPPKQPQQKPDDQPGQGETPSGPAGTKDDPHYVKSADGTPTPPQGAMTSALALAPMTAGF